MTDKLWSTDNWHCYLLPPLRAEALDVDGVELREVIVGVGSFVVAHGPQQKQSGHDVDHSRVQSGAANEIQQGQVLDRATSDEQNGHEKERERDLMPQSTSQNV